jgi:thioredoxin 1
VRRQDSQKRRNKNLDKKMTRLLNLTSVKKNICVTVVTLYAALFAFSTGAFADTDNIPAKGMVTMIDLGAKSCIPCKMMAPILEKMEKEYSGKAIIHFYDVWKDNEPAMRFKIRVIPTQIFFNLEAKEVYRHEGFMSENEIVRQLSKMGVK